MSATYYHYTVWAEENDEDSSNRVDPRKAFNSPFLQQESENESEVGDDDDPGVETTDDQENTDESDPDETTDEDDTEEGYRLETDEEIYFFIFDQIFLDADDGTTQTAFYGKGQRNRENRLFEAEIEEAPERLKDIVNDDDLSELIDESDADELDESDIDWSAAIPEDSAARMGVLYGETEIHLLIEQNSTAPGIKKQSRS
jgi:hypothetical protein